MLCFLFDIGIAFAYNDAGKFLPYPLHPVSLTQPGRHLSTSWQPGKNSVGPDLPCTHVHSVDVV